SPSRTLHFSRAGRHSSVVTTSAAVFPYCFCHELYEPLWTLSSWPAGLPHGMFICLRPARRPSSTTELTTVPLGTSRHADCASPNRLCPRADLGRDARRATDSDLPRSDPARGRTRRTPPVAHDDRREGRAARGHLGTEESNPGRRRALQSIESQGAARERHRPDLATERSR